MVGFSLFRLRGARGCRGYRPWLMGLLGVLLGGSYAAAQTAAPVTLTVSSTQLTPQPWDAGNPGLVQSRADVYRFMVGIKSTQTGFIRLVFLCSNEVGRTNSAVRSWPRNLPVGNSTQGPYTLGLRVDPSYGTQNLNVFFSACEGHNIAYLWAEGIPASGNLSTAVPVPGKGDRVSEVTRLYVLGTTFPGGALKAVIPMWHPGRQDHVNVGDGRLMAAASAAGYTQALPFTYPRYFCVNRLDRPNSDPLYNSFSASRGDNIMSRGIDALGWLRTAPHDYTTIYPPYPMGYSSRTPIGTAPSFLLKQWWRADFADNVVALDNPVDNWALPAAGYGAYWSIGYGYDPMYCIESVEGDGHDNPAVYPGFSKDRPVTNLPGNTTPPPTSGCGTQVAPENSGTMFAPSTPNPNGYLYQVQRLRDASRNYDDFTIFVKPAGNVNALPLYTFNINLATADKDVSTNAFWCNGTHSYSTTVNGGCETDKEQALGILLQQGIKPIMNRTYPMYLGLPPLIEEVSAILRCKLQSAGKTPKF